MKEKIKFFGIKQCYLKNTLKNDEETKPNTAIKNIRSTDKN